MAVFSTPARVALTALIVVAGLASSASCKNDDDSAPPPPEETLATQEQMLDSRFCGACHQQHYDEWAASMHAYAADDPVFRALNAKMQAESPPDKQDFCLNCHAPMAVKLGKPLDFASLDAHPELKGVSCFFCHTTNAVNGQSNNPLGLSSELIMGGAIRDPVDPKVHKAEYRTWLDGKADNQAGMCGACHDIVAIQGAHIERTFGEWRGSQFGVAVRDKTSCANCHMPERDGVAAVRPDSLPPRKLHDHSMVGVDLALVDFPGKAIQRDKVQKLLDDAVDAHLCVRPDTTGMGGGTIEITLQSQRVGHSFPSGANQDRRSWIDLTASAAGDVVLRSGAFADDAVIDGTADPNLFLLRDHDFDAMDQPTELFWRAARVESKQLPVASSDNPANPGHDNSVKVSYPVTRMPDTVSMALKIRPIDFDLLSIAEGLGLDRSKLDPITTVTMAKTRLEWKAGGADCVP